MEAVIISGIPASGKSTLARMFEEDGYHRVERDIIRKEHFGWECWNTWDWGKEGEVSIVWNQLLSSYIKQKVNIVISDTKVNSSSRMKLIDQLKEKEYNVTLVMLNTSLDICLERNQKRGTNKVNDSIVRGMHRRMNEGFNDIHIS